MNKKLIIVGTGLMAEVVLPYFEEHSGFEVAGFATEAQYATGDTFLGYPLFKIEELKDCCPEKEYQVFVAVGYNQLNSIRKKLFFMLDAMGYTFATYIAPNVKTWPSNKVGRNVFIFEDNTIQPYVELRDGVILWSGNHIGHHSKILDFVFIASHVVVSGNCVIGEETFIGVNATLRDDLVIGKRNIIGAAAVMLKSSKDEEVYAAKRTDVYKKKSSEVSI